MSNVKRIALSAAIVLGTAFPLDLPGSRRPVAGQGSRPIVGTAASSRVSSTSSVER